jgi:hypothetical protein
MEYTLIANTVDGRQLVGHGYTTYGQVQRAIADRVRFHKEDSTRGTKIVGMVLVQSNGTVMFVDANGIVTPRIASAATV